MSLRATEGREAISHKPCLPRFSRSEIHGVIASQIGPARQRRDETYLVLHRREPIEEKPIAAKQSPTSSIPACLDCSDKTLCDCHSRASGNPGGFHQQVHKQVLSLPHPVISVKHVPDLIPVFTGMTGSGDQVVQDYLPARLVLRAGVSRPPVSRSPVSRGDEK